MLYYEDIFVGILLCPSDVSKINKNTSDNVCIPKKKKSYLFIMRQLWIGYNKSKCIQLPFALFGGVKN